MKKETESRQRSKNVEKATNFSMKMETSFLVYFVAWVSQQGSQLLWRQCAFRFFHQVFLIQKDCLFACQFLILQQAKIFLIHYVQTMVGIYSGREKKMKCPFATVADKRLCGRCYLKKHVCVCVCMCVARLGLHVLAWPVLCTCTLICISWMQHQKPNVNVQLYRSSELLSLVFSFSLSPLWSNPLLCRTKCVCVCVCVPYMPDVCACSQAVFLCPTPFLLKRGTREKISISNENLQSVVPNFE